MRSTLLLLTLALVACSPKTVEIPAGFERPSSKTFGSCALNTGQAFNADGTTAEQISLLINVPGAEAVDVVARRLGAQPEPIVVRSTPSFIWDPAPEAMGDTGFALLAEPLRTYSGGRFVGYSVAFSGVGATDEARVGDRVWILLSELLTDDPGAFRCGPDDEPVPPDEPPPFFPPPPEPR
ncbi:MAG: hypothetical protein AAGI52_11585 [Bacteroidota bacterium]